jgi:hypothetical protein
MCHEQIQVTITVPIGEGRSHRGVRRARVVAARRARIDDSPSLTLLREATRSIVDVELIRTAANATHEQIQVVITVNVCPHGCGRPVAINWFGNWTLQSRFLGDVGEQPLLASTKQSTGGRKVCEKQILDPIPIEVSNRRPPNERSKTTRLAPREPVKTNFAGDINVGPVSTVSRS